MYCALESSDNACALMMRSMLADQPYLLVTTTHGVVDNLFEIFTFSIESGYEVKRASFHHFVNGLKCSFVFLNCFFSPSSASPNFMSSLEALENLNSSNSVKFCIVYSSIGSVK